MRICDRCKSPNGVTKVRFSVATTYLSEGCEQEAVLKSTDADLCNTCYTFFSSFGIFRAVRSFLDSPGDWRPVQQQE